VTGRRPSSTTDWVITRGFDARRTDRQVENSLRRRKEKTPKSLHMDQPRAKGRSNSHPRDKASQGKSCPKSLPPCLRVYKPVTAVEVSVPREDSFRELAASRQ